MYTKVSQSSQFLGNNQILRVKFKKSITLAMDFLEVLFVSFLQGLENR